MKKSKFMLLATLLTCIFIMLIILPACQKDDIPPKNPANQDLDLPAYTLALEKYYTKNQNPHISEYFDEEAKLNLIEKIDSKEQLIGFCNDKKLSVFDETSKSYSDSLSKKLREFDDAFFKDNSIALVFKFKEDEDYYKFDSVEINDNVLTVNLLQANGESTVQTHTKAYVIQLNKENTKDVNQIKINKIDEETTVRIYDYSTAPIVKENAPSSFLIDSKEYMNIFCDEETSPYFKKNELTPQDVYPNKTDEELNDEGFLELFNKMYNERNKKMIELLKTYDEEFFQNKSLVFIFKSRPNPILYKFESMSVDDNSLKITLSALNDTGWNFDVMEYYIYLIEVDKQDVAGVNQIIVEDVKK